MRAGTSQGSVVFSVEIELAWGFHDLYESDRYGGLSRERSAETDALRWLLMICDKYEIPVSFNVVGHLLVDECSGKHGESYPDGWFDADPGTDVKTDPLLYAPDLINMVREASVNHEVCTHTFSHALAEDFSHDQFSCDLQAAQDIHNTKLGSRTNSLVPPRHQSVDYNILRNNSIRVVRETYGQIPKSRPARFLWYFTRRHPVMSAEEYDGVVVTHTSPVQSLTAPLLPQGQRGVHPVFKIIPSWARQAAHLRYVEDAISRAYETSTQAHFWAHLHDMANTAQMNIVEKIARMVTRKRKSGQVRIERMCDLT